MLADPTGVTNENNRVTREPLPLSTGDLLLDRYRIEATFRAGMGILWAVRDAQTGERYAVKAIKGKDKDNARLREEFLAAARTWIALDRHENLVQAYWLEPSEHGPLLFLEFVDGCDLEAAIEREGRIKLPRALDFAMQTAAGMAYAHTRRMEGGVGVVHRDLKPSNLLIGAGDRLKVSDFGLARAFRAGGTVFGGAGTPAYMAPEQIEAGRAVDGRTDVYAFGLVLHEMLAGTNPLAADNLQEQIDRILNLVPPPLEDAPPALAALVARCTAKDRDERPSDFFEVLGHLAHIARRIEYPWHRDLTTIPEPSRPTGLAIGAPVLRPRSPLAGEPFVVDSTLRGDLGRGPVAIELEPGSAKGLQLLTPPEGLRVRVEAGGPVQLHARVTFQADEEGRYTVEPGRLRVVGPDAETNYRMPGFEAFVRDAFVLPWVGRSRELQRLRELVSGLRRKEGGTLFVFGDVGAGRTRLLLEAERLAAEADLRVARARAAATGHRPMRLLNELARRLLDLTPGPVRGVRSAVHDLLGRDPPTARYFMQILTGQAAPEQEAPLAHRWFELIRAAAERAPILLLLDDLQWAATTAVEVVLELAIRIRDARLPVLMLATARKEPAGAPAAQARVRMLREACRFAACIDLGPLRKEDLAHLVDAVFVGHGFHEEAPWFLDTIQDVTQGNPLHIAEILRSLRTGNSGAITCAGGEWRLAASLSPKTLRAMIPGALEEAVGRRVEALSPGAREVVRAAALAGNEFDLPVVRVALKDPERVDKAIEELEEAQIVAPVSAELDRYRFRSALLAEVARRRVARLDPKRRRLLHRAVAQGMLEAFSGEGRLRRSLAIAHHLRRAGEPQKSLPFTLRGCERLLGLHLGERARRLLSNAEPLFLKQRISAAQRAQFHYLFGLACEASGEYEKGLQELTRFLESAVDLEIDRRRMPRAYMGLGRIHQALGDYERAQYCFGLAREFYEELKDRRKLAFVEASLSALALKRGRLNQAARFLAQAGRLAQESGNEGAAVAVLLLRGRLELLLGAGGRPRKAFVEAERRARALGDRPQQAAALIGLGRTALKSGYLRRARARIEEAIALYGRMGDRSGLGEALVRLGEAEATTGAVERALLHHRRAVRVFSEIGRAEGVAMARHRIGSLLAAAGRPAEAIRELATAAEGLKALGLPDQHDALRDLGRALAGMGSMRPARLALARADRGTPAGAHRRTARVMDRCVRSRMALAAGETDRALMWARRATVHARRTTRHRARTAAALALAEAELRAGDMGRAGSLARTGLAFAKVLGDPFSIAVAERILVEIAGRAGNPVEALARARRAIRAYSGRRDCYDGPARLLAALARALAGIDSRRALRLRRAAARCYSRLESHGYRVPEQDREETAGLAGVGANR